MKDRNENRPAYRNTKVGWIPQEWETISLYDICEHPVSGYSANGADRPAGKDEYGVLKLNCIQNGRFVSGENKLVLEDQVSKLKTPLSKGTLLVSRSNTDELVGAICYVDHVVPKLFLSDLLWEISALDGASVSLRWLSYLLCSEHYRAQIVARANGTSGSMKKLTKPSFLGIRVPFPPLPEQKKIAEILSSWDEAIEQTRRLIEVKKRRKKALMQQLLTAKKRLPGFNEPWEEFLLGDLFDERVEVNNDHLPLLAITGSRGVIPASEIVRKDSSNTDKSRYKRIAPGDIGYNTMRMWQGVSAVSRLEGIVSPAYTVCIPKKGLDACFMGYLFKFSPVINLLRRYSQGLVNDTLNLKFPNFAKIKVRIPALDEQRRIAELLSTADSEIESLKTKLSALEKQKRGLMQKLLTGEVRVKS